MSKAHVNYVKAHSAHNPPGSGCIIYCTGKYEPGNPHSHRWNAAERARGESRVPYNDFPLHESKQYYRPKSVFDGLQAFGGIDGPITATGSTYTANVHAFHRADHPFAHNAHHLIPSGNIEKYINKVMAKAAPNQGRMKDLVVGGLLTEPYNNNDQPNMIVLPTQLDAAQTLGLPQHTDGQPNHKKYSKMADKLLKSKFVRLYRGLSSAVAAEVHPKTQKVPTAGPMMVGISNQTYEAIIAASAGGGTLNSIARVLKRLARRAVGR